MYKHENRKGDKFHFYDLLAIEHYRNWRYYKGNMPNSAFANEDRDMAHVKKWLIAMKRYYGYKKTTKSYARAHKTDLIPAKDADTRADFLRSLPSALDRFTFKFMPETPRGLELWSQYLRYRFRKTGIKGDQLV